MTFQLEDSIKLYYTNNNHRGPGKVVQNLIKGLRGLDYKILSPNDKNEAKCNCWLQDCYREELFIAAEKNKSRLLGPNLFVLPSDRLELCRLSNNFIVPSEWVKDLYLQFEEMKNKNIYVWPVGVDVNYWQPSKNSFKNLDCFIYFKNRSEKDLAVVEAICRKFKLNYKTVKYGSYNEKQLLDLCHNSKFSIVLDGTESQGVFLLEMLSTNLPCYIFNNPIWKSECGKWSCPATTVPYFNKNCGEVSCDVSLEHFSVFLQNINNDYYNPRQYIENNFTLEKCAQNYINILNEINY